MKPTVLVIEDNADTARLLGIVLTEYKWVYEHADTLRAGIARAHTHPYPEVILLDLNLPDSAPWQTVTHLSELMQHGPVVVLSNYQDPVIEEAIAKQGAFYCRKELDQDGAKRIFSAMVRAVDAWRDADVRPKKTTSKLDTNLLQLAVVSSALRAHGG